MDMAIDWSGSSPDDTLVEEEDSLEGVPMLDSAPPPDRSSKPQSSTTNRSPPLSIPDPSEASQSVMSRGYQIEMFERSMERNVLVVMPTGTGKTQVAILRMKAELERSPAKKRIWFLAPTVMLCEQQAEVIQSQIAFAQVRVLSSNDGIEAWSTLQVWRAALHNIKIVVSSPQVLLDALSHAFVRMESLSLIVIDEAHNCLGNHPVAKIMREFYHQNKRSGRPIPHILGMSATPSMTATTKDLEHVEEVLDVVCRSPVIHRDELLARSKKPNLRLIRFPMTETPACSSVESLLRMYTGLSILEDPQIRHWRLENSLASRDKLHAAVVGRKTECFSQIETLYSRSLRILKDMGRWAADYYISEVIRLYCGAPSSGYDGPSYDLSAQIREYLQRKLQLVEVESPTPHSLTSRTISEKTLLLINELASRSKDTVGIVFVKERVMVTVLAHLLSNHPAVKNKYRIGTMLGLNESTLKASDLSDITRGRGSSLASLQNFRSGQINLVIATSVLEEGIDVPACNLVINYDKLETLKSFIQRRGRARMRESSLVVMLEDSPDLPKDWEALEFGIQSEYENDMREARRLAEIEELELPVTDMRFIVESTGAQLSIDNARQHLQHFCSVLSVGDFIDARPDYIICEVTEDPTPLLRARVLLPKFIPEHVRVAESARLWTSQKNAMKDAAFQAYMNLYRDHLVDDHLLPLRIAEQELGTESRTSMIEAADYLPPWYDLASLWKVTNCLWNYRLSLINEKQELVGEYWMILPALVPSVQPITLYIDETRIWTVRIDKGIKSSRTLQNIGEVDQTAVFLSLAYGHRNSLIEKDSQLIASFIARNETLSLDQLGNRSAIVDELEREAGQYLVRDESGCPYIYSGTIPDKPEIEMVRRPFRGYQDAPTGEEYLNLRKWPRRTDFLHRVGDGQKPSPSLKPYTAVLPVSCARVDSIHIRHAHFGMLIPSILHELEVQLLSHKLSDTILASIEIRDPILIRTAISARSASEPYDYERLEFLGDSMLKACAAINVAALHLNWPEGYLSMAKDQLVSNSRLFKATLKHGLDRFVLRRPFTGKKWVPPYIHYFANEPPAGNGKKKKKQSTKTLADVVEALIGASFVDGGIDKALLIISMLIPGLEWMTPMRGLAMLREDRRLEEHPSNTLAPVEEIIGYTFTQKGLLVEALTHGSYNGPSSRSLERLEFVGDAILDQIVVERLFFHEPPLSHDQMHLFKTAVVNSDFLAFLVLNQSIEEDRGIVSKDGSRIGKTRVRQSLWKFMRHSSYILGLDARATEERHAELQEPIREALATADHYPWALLARLQAKKFFSDIFESLLCAIWIDSGSMEACEKLLERFGLLDCLSRLVDDAVEVMHPKGKLGQLAGDQKVRYSVTTTEGLDPGNPQKEYQCRVMVGDVCVAEVHGGVDREEVRSKAAEVAVRNWTPVTS